MVFNQCFFMKYVNSKKKLLNTGRYVMVNIISNVYLICFVWALSKQWEGVKWSLEVCLPFGFYLLYFSF